MPYTPTSWDDLEKSELGELFLKIICSPCAGNEYTAIPEIRPIMSSVITALANGEEAPASSANSEDKLLKVCWDFAKYQRDMWSNDDEGRRVFMDEGFQIGSPWHGDILKARFLFLSSNPNVNKKCIFPRWHPGNDPEYTFYRISTSGNLQLGQNTPNGISIENIYNFFRDRLTTAPFSRKDKKIHLGAWRIKNVKKGLCERYSVSYWEWLCRFTGKILGKSCPEEIMRSVLSAEIIPWGSKNEAHAKNDPDRLDYFWKAFTAPMLKHCKAEIIFLVGSEARKTFNSITGRKDKAGIKAGEVLDNIELSGRKFIVAAVDHPRYANIKGNDKRNNNVAKQIATRL